MAADTLRYVDVVLSWARAESGTTAVLKREQGSAGWTEIGRTQGTGFRAEGLHPERAYTFAAVAVLEDGGLAPEDEWETVRVAPMADEGTPELPGTPSGFAASQDGANLIFRWSTPSDGVTVTHEIRVGSTWEDGTRVATDLSNSPYSWTWSASGSQTFHLKAVDRQERTSRAAATVTITIEPLDDHVTEDTSDEGAQGWTGPKTHVEPDGGALRLERLPEHFGAATSPFGSFVGVPCFAKYWPEGVYETLPFDAGQVEHQRVEVDLGVEQPVDATLPFGAVRRPALGARRKRDGTTIPLGRRGFASKNSWRLTPLLPPDVHVEIDTSQTAAGPWDGYRPHVPGTYTFWRCRLRVTVRGDGIRFVCIRRLVIVRRKFNHKDEGTVVLPGRMPVELTFAAPFTVAPAVVATLVGPNPSLGVKIEATAISPTSCHLEAFDGAGVSIPATVCWHALGT